MRLLDLDLLIFFFALSHIFDGLVFEIIDLGFTHLIFFLNKSLCLSFNLPLEKLYIFT